MDTLLVFILGSIIGSFLNVCIYRIPRDESVSFPPSHCTKCGNRIKWYDLFPIISYLILKGKCRYCKEKISSVYPLIETFTGICFAALYISYGPSLDFIKYVIMSCFLIVIGMIDLMTTDVYLKTTLPGIITGTLFIAVAYHTGYGILNYIYGGAASFGLIAVIILLTHGMGWGDAEICLLCGLFLGLRLAAVMIFIAFVAGGITGAILLIFKIKSRKDMIPFGPFIASGAIIASLLGEKLINIYMGLM